MLEANNDVLLVGMADPTDLSAFDKISRVVKCSIEVAVVTEGQLLECFDRWYRRSDNVIVLPQEPTSGVALINTSRSDHSPAMQFLQKLFDEAARMRASDIYLEPQAESLLVRYRVNGELRRYDSTSNQVSAEKLLQCLKQLCGFEQGNGSLPQEGCLHICSGERKMKALVSTCPTGYGESVAMRLLFGDRMLSLENLDMPTEMLGRLHEVMARHDGMVIVTGLSAAGRRKTLYASLTEVDAFKRKTITIDNELMHSLTNISQIQLDSSAGLTFSVAWRAALGQDPEVILLGDSSDIEAARAALNAVLTGRLLLSQFAAKNSVVALSSLLNMGLPRFALMSSRLVVLAQYVLRGVCKECSEPYEPDAQETEWLKNTGMVPKNYAGLSRGQGCSHCDDTGYSGERVVYELLEVTSELNESVMGSDIADFVRIATQVMQGKTMLSQALVKMQQGETSLAEVMRCAELT